MICFELRIQRPPSPEFTVVGDRADVERFSRVVRRDIFIIRASLVAHPHTTTHER